MQLSKIIESLESIKIFGSKNFEITGISEDSREVKKGNLFVAIKGLKTDAHSKIEEVIKKGALCVVGEKKPRKSWIDKCTYIRVKDSRKTLALLASEWNNNPSKKLRVIGITGTDGKTTTANIIYSILKRAGIKVGLISTVGACINGKTDDLGFHVTNPEPLALHAFLSKMVKTGCTHLVLEVTSHGIDQKRVLGLILISTILTNITHEHLDYHGSFEAYAKTKIDFILSGKTVIANENDLSFNEIKDKIKKQKLVSYGVGKGDILAKNITSTDSGVSFTTEIFSEEVKFKTSLIGSYQVSNCLAAISCAKTLKIKNSIISQAIKSFKLPVGRMQEIKNKREIKVYIDFAHTPDSLRKTLLSLKPLTKKRLICVFGCAGERDKQKRKIMGKISSEIADVSIFTAEDPRSEDVNNILKSMKKGAQAAKAEEIVFGLKAKKEKLKENVKYFTLVPERQEAIAFAFQNIAEKGDLIVIAGKGHESSLAFETFEHPWSDKNMVSSVLNTLDCCGAVILAAGKGTRMKSPIPKVLLKIAGRPMISYTLENLRNAGLKNIVAVVGFKKQILIDAIKGAVDFVYQPNILGTADAAIRGIRKCKNNIQKVLVLNGDDSAFYTPETIRKVIKDHIDKKAVVSFVSFEKENPEGLGRVVRDSKGRLLGIVEHKEANEKQLKIKEVNDGLYVFDKEWAEKNFKRIERRKNGEYYIGDFIAIALADNRIANAYKLKDSSEWQGINTPEQLKEANQKMFSKLSK